MKNVSLERQHRRGFTWASLVISIRCSIENDSFRHGSERFNCWRIDSLERKIPPARISKTSRNAATADGRLDKANSMRISMIFEKKKILFLFHNDRISFYFGRKRFVSETTNQGGGVLTSCDLRLKMFDDQFSFLSIENETIYLKPSNRLNRLESI